VFQCLRISCNRVSSGKGKGRKCADKRKIMSSNMSLFYYSQNRSLITFDRSSSSIFRLCSSRPGAGIPISSCNESSMHRHPLRASSIILLLMLKNSSFNPAGLFAKINISQDSVTSATWQECLRMSRYLSLLQFSKFARSARSPRRTCRRGSRSGGGNLAARLRSGRSGVKRWASSLSHAPLSSVRVRRRVRYVVTCRRFARARAKERKRERASLIVSAFFTRVACMSLYVHRAVACCSDPLYLSACLFVRPHVCLSVADSHAGLNRGHRVEFREPDSAWSARDRRDCSRRFLRCIARKCVGNRSSVQQRDRRSSFYRASVETVAQTAASCPWTTGTGEMRWVNRSILSSCSLQQLGNSLAHFSEQFEQAINLAPAKRANFTFICLANDPGRECSSRTFDGSCDAPVPKLVRDYWSRVHLRSWESRSCHSTRCRERFFDRRWNSFGHGWSVSRRHV